MQNELYNLKELRKEILKRKQNDDYSLSGKMGHCFIKGDKVVKIYDYSRNSTEFCDLTKFKSDCISFPIDYIYEKGKIIGEILPYYHAYTADVTLNVRSNAISFMKYYDEIEKEIEKFPNIKMIDLWIRNILYSSRKGFYLIDTSDWIIKEENYSAYNIRLFDNSLFYLLKDLIYDSINNKVFFEYLCESVGSGESLLELLKVIPKTISLRFS